MSFVIRQVSRTSDGREIVRPANFSGRSISVGRDAGCEVQLADLAVELRHASIELNDQNQVIVLSTCGLGFASNGRVTSRAEIDLRNGSELRFGSHRLTIAGGGESVIITVERVEALSDSSVDRDENGLFTLQRVLLSRRTGAWALLIAVLAIFLAWPIYTFETMQGVKKRPIAFHADSMWSTGPMSSAHKSLATNCQACHTQVFVAVTDTSCLSCHSKDAHKHADPARIARSKEAPDLFGRVGGFFKASFNVPEGRCVECHTEHEGAGKMEPTAQKFCTDCHASLDTRLTDTKLPNAGDFGTAHPQFRPAIVTDPTTAKPTLLRVSLDSKPREDNGLKFPHAVHLSKTNGIARMAQTMKAETGFGDALACKDCHTKTADGTRFKPVEMEQDCQMCHSLGFDNVGGTIRTLRHGEPLQVAADLRAYYRSTTPARPINLGGMVRRRPGNYALAETAQDYAIGARAWPARGESAVRSVFAQGGACYDCHVISQTPAGWNVRKVVQPVRYMNKGWFDHNAHKTETCQLCHGAESSNLASDVLLPDLKSCRTCHVGEGGATLHSVKKPVESSCAMCHEYHVDGGAPWRTDLQLRKQKNKPKRADQIAMRIK